MRKQAICIKVSYLDLMKRILKGKIQNNVPNLYFSHLLQNIKTANFAFSFEKYFSLCCMSIYYL